MPAYLPEKKNLFIFRNCPEDIFMEDSYIILKNEEFFKRIKLEHIQNIFSLFTFPLWLKHYLKVSGINVFFINSEGSVSEVYLDRKNEFPVHNYSEYEAFCILRHKAFLIDKLFGNCCAESALKFSGEHMLALEEINIHLNLLVKVSFVDKISTVYGISTQQADRVVSVFLNLTDNIVPLAFFSEFKDIPPDIGILNSSFPSTIRDLVEIPVVRFKRKLLYFFESEFFDIDDLRDDSSFSETIFRFLKVLSNYFFYSNRFKRKKEVLYIKNSFKRGNLHEIFGCV